MFFKRRNFSIFGTAFLILREYVFEWIPDFVPAVFVFTVYAIMICRAKWWAEGKSVAIGRYRSAEQFLFCMKDEPHYDLAFLDIQMSKINGLQLAKMIREEDRLIFLVFTTALKKYAPRGYEVSAFRYLIKPLQEDEVFQALTKVSQMMEDRKKEAVIVKRGDEFCIVTWSII